MASTLEILERHLCIRGILTPKKFWLTSVKFFRGLRAWVILRHQDISPCISYYQETETVLGWSI